jgi:hypothetical protein
MQNLRLPEFDKSRIIYSQKDLIFQSETCKYDVILGADFLTKTGIDVKYSTGTMEWFDTELSLRNPHLLETKDKKYMGTHCHTKYMGTHCHKKLLGHIANKKYRGGQIAIKKLWKTFSVMTQMLSMLMRLVPFPIPRRTTWRICTSY